MPASCCEPAGNIACHPPANASTGKAGAPCCPKTLNLYPAFEPMSKRRRGFPSETQVKRGVRLVHGDKELAEKLGRNDLCPCQSGKLFRNCCLKSGRFRRRKSSRVLSGK
ncbi:MAG: SEC-C metal-binding domain-containing protein [Planctomycetaceae bacterium]